MMGLQPATPNYRVARNLTFLSETKSKDFGQSEHIGTFESSERLKKLRIPDKLCKNLPSVRDFAESKRENVMSFNDTAEEDVKKLSVANKRCRSLPGRIKFKLLAECEAKFSGIIWDIGFLKSGDVFICYGDGIVICDRSLTVKTILGNVKLAGGASVMPSGHFVAVDRFNDTVNIYSSDGQFISSFLAGSSPMNVAVNKDNFIAVTDIGDKCVRVYSMEGTLLNMIAQKGRGYELQWPLYIQVNTDNSFIVSDVLQRKVFSFDEHGSYVKTLQLKTYGANSVLRPHGICAAKSNKFFVVDNALNTIEVFGPNDDYIQTILLPEEGSNIKPKVLDMSDDGYLIVGGMTGSVKLFKFIEFDLKAQDVKEEEPSEEVHCMLVDADDAVTVDNKYQIPKIELKVESTSNDPVIIID